MRRQRLGDRAFARGSGAVDRDDHCANRSSSASKSGKLVATGRTSSISIPSRLAEEADDTKYGRIVCPLRDGHTRGGKRIGALSIIVNPSAVKDFTFSWSGDILILQRMLDLFGRFGVSGFEAKRARVSNPKKTRDTPPDLFELVVTGWAGWAAPAAASIRRFAPP